MNIRAALLREHSKAQASKIADYIDNDPDRFSELMELFLGSEYRVTQRAAWVVSHCYDKHPSVVKQHLSPLVHNLQNNIPIAVKRNTLHILQTAEIPNDLMGIIADYCFKFLASSSEPIAVRVFSMTILSNIAKVHPEMKRELQMVIEAQMPSGSAGFISRGRKILKELSKTV